MLIGSLIKVVHHLDRLGVLCRQMILLNDSLHEVLMDQLSEGPPELAILHHQQVVAARHQIMRDIRWRSVAVFGASFVQKFLDDPTVCHD